MQDQEQIDEIMARVRKLELKARRLVRESFSGEYLSSFRGQGLDFDDFRQYQHGDEVRFIDWNVTARMNEPYVRKFHEERELSVILAVDVSGSTDFGSHHLSKRELSAEIAAVLGFSALQNGDKVGLLLFADEPLLFVEPAKGSRHLLRLIREILLVRPKKQGSSIQEPCDFLIRSLKRKSFVFFISDFYAEELDRPLGKLSKKHELVALRVLDRVEIELPNAGRVVMLDAETGFETLVNTSDASLRKIYGESVAQQSDLIAGVFKKHGIDSTTLLTDEDSLPALHQLLKRRHRRKG